MKNDRTYIDREINKLTLSKHAVDLDRVHSAMRRLSYFLSDESRNLLAQSLCLLDQATLLIELIKEEETKANGK